VVLQSEHDGSADHRGEAASDAVSVAAPVIARAPRRDHALMTPRPVPGDSGLVTVDATWGTISPMQIAPGVHTVGELEVIEHIRAGRPLIDTRRPHFHGAGTIPGACNIPHTRIEDAIGSLDRSRPTVLFCNGPQCAATPNAIRSLLEAGHAAAAILYYRGGIHDWVTLGLPLERP
jgi:rhodanese-related sulfurtransferase